MSQEKTSELSYMLGILVQLLDTPSPTGLTGKAIGLIEEELQTLGVQSQRTPKGALTWEIAGTGDQHVTLSGHVDTLGAMVKAIKDNGRLSLHMLGGYDWATIEGEDVQVHTQEGRVITGTVVNVKQSTHVHGPELRNLQRDQSNMEVRLDEVTRSSSETLTLGIKVGDFVSLDAHPVVTPSGYVKARHLDNKAAVAIFLYMTRQLIQTPPTKTVAFHITTYEEVGHGAATGIPEQTNELIAVDMAAVGEGQTSSEHHATLCVADSTGPYDHDLSNRLRKAGKDAGIDLRVDIYPYYGSDGSAAWRAGGNYPVALVGPGVDASHAYERTHTEALEATTDLLMQYLAE